MYAYLRQAIKTWAILGGIMVLMIVVVTSVNVGAFAIDRIARQFGGHFGALPGYEDFVRLAISSAVMMFFPYCQYMRGHVVVDLFASRMSLRTKRTLDNISLAATGCLALFLAYWMTMGMVETYNDNAVSRVLGWPEWPFYSPGIVSLLLWAVIAWVQIFNDKGQSHDGVHDGP